MRPKTSQSLHGPARSLCDIIKLGYFHQIRLLMSRGISIGSRDSAKRTPLILCAFMEPEEWSVSTAMSLIESDVYVGQRDIFGRSVLHYACIYERQNLVRVLLRAIDFDLNQADTLGNTSFHYAAMSGNLVITRLLAESFKKYQVNCNKVNHQGRTALEEALEAGNIACAHIVQMELASGRDGSAGKDVRFTDDAVLGSNSSCFGSQYLSPPNGRNMLRPVSAAFLGRSDSSPWIRSGIQAGSSSPLRSRSSSSIRFSSGLRRSTNSPQAGSFKRDDEVIHCAPEQDFRNNADYVCKLANLPCDPEIWDDASTRNRGSWSGISSVRVAPKKEIGWRQELEQLFKAYEHQCSASWRASGRVDKPTQTVTPSPVTEDEEKGKKTRAHNIVSKNAHGKDISPDPKRRAPSVRLRKIQNGKIPCGTSVDGSLDTSTESINSLVSTKRRGLDKEISLGRPENLSTKQRVQPSKETNSSAQQPEATPCTPPQGPSPPSPTERSHAEKMVSQTANISSPQPIKTSSNQQIVDSCTVSVSASIRPSTSRQKLTAATDHQIVDSCTVSVSASIRPSTSRQKLTAATAGNPTRPVKNQTESRPAELSMADSIVIKHPNVPAVKETLIADERHNRSLLQPVDTSKLWVHNPYESQDEEDDTDSGGGE